MTIPAETFTEIQQHVARLEREHAMTVLFACESGSRAWGFESPDSDFDVRFVYARQRDWYLTITPGRDVIDEPISGDMDIAGWDLRKALGLLRNGNATVIEWLDSPVIYKAEPGFIDAANALATESFRSDRNFHHYMSLSNTQYRQAHQDGGIQLKRFLYTLRGALSAQWTTEQPGKPPMTLAALADALVPSPVIRRSIDELIGVKSGLAEKADYAVPDALVDYLEELLVRLAQHEPAKIPPLPEERFDAFFREWIER